MVQPHLNMKIFLIVFATFIITSLFWLNLIAFFPEYIPVPEFAQEYQYEQIKKQKEMEIKAEIEIMLGKDGLKEFEALFKSITKWLK